MEDKKPADPWHASIRKIFGDMIEGIVVLGFFGLILAIVAIVCTGGKWTPW